MNTKSLTKMAMIAALYTAASLVLAPISYGNIQCRVSEALTILAVGGPFYIGALTFGCFLANLFGLLFGVNAIGWMDLVFGTLATLLGCLLSYYFRNIRFKNYPVVSGLMPVVTNGIIVGLELALTYGGIYLWPLMALEVAVGELIAVIIGLLLYPYLEKHVLNKTS